MPKSEKQRLHLEKLCLMQKINHPKGMLGKKHSELTKNKISLIKIGKKRLKFSEEWKKKISESLRREKSPRWKGGKTRDCNGYTLVNYDSNTKKYRLEHRVVMENFLGRKLKTEEFVHHKNGVKNDNRIENLEIVTSKTHLGKVECPKCKFNFNIL